MNHLGELIFQPQFKDTLSIASNCCRDSSSTSILEVFGNQHLEWSPQLDHINLKDWLERRKVQPKTASFRIFFISGRRNQHNFHVHIDPTVLTLLRDEVGLSERFISDVYETEDWTRLAFGSTVRKNADGGLESLAIHYGFWTWDEPDSAHSFVHSRTDLSTTTYFCINFPLRMIDRIAESVRADCSSVGKLFYTDVLVADELLNGYRRAISERNTKLISIEKETDHSPIEEQTKRLHDLSVNWHTICKDLLDLEEHIASFNKLYHVLAPGNQSVEGCDQPLEQLNSTCQFYKRWAMTYRDRTQSRINLLHHLAAQHDNHVNQHISNVTTLVALQSQRDSTSMFTLAVVTMVFLPPTFVAGVFSTPFFEAGTSFMSVSHKVWIMPAVAVPLTIVVLAVWVIWFRRRIRRNKAAILKTKGSSNPLRLVEDGPAYVEHIEMASARV